MDIYMNKYGIPMLFIILTVSVKNVMRKYIAIYVFVFVWEIRRGRCSTITPNIRPLVS